eukprot:NODE_1996_length_1331_cov_75.313573_g1812_i0.p1 GENE.NODE_1996_length_1331_cov_75.313573_g1812_i0~~NODE_1996_length_1331_cov_75.313573_g1812_i0.p1  ORF type:complete len:286 (+),score=83.76 NODE_1996_length_1331_cov_75.313573_g1812_i0:75-860(+)
MFEATLEQGQLLKKILEAVKDLVTEANLECSASGIQLQAMDTSHVSLVTLLLKGSGFERYRCDRNTTLGLNLNSMSKILKCAGNDDSITLRSQDDGDTVTFVFESKAKDKVSDFQLKLMAIDAESLGIPEQEYKAVVTMPSAEFQRICRDLSMLGDTVNIAVSKEGVNFAASGDIGAGKILVKQNTAADAPEDSTIIELQEPVNLNFALRYLITFSKAAALSEKVKLSMAKEVPLVVEFSIGEFGYIRYYLAPKIDDETGQ